MNAWTADTTWFFAGYSYVILSALAWSIWVDRSPATYLVYLHFDEDARPTP